MDKFFIVKIFKNEGLRYGILGDYRTAAFGHYSLSVSRSLVRDCIVFNPFGLPKSVIVYNSGSLIFSKTNSNSFSLGTIAVGLL